MTAGALGRRLVTGIGLVLGLPLLLFVLVSPAAGYLVVFAPVAAVVAIPALVVAFTAGSLAERRPTISRFLGGIASGGVAAIVPIGGWWPERVQRRHPLQTGTELIWRPSVGTALFIVFAAIMVWFWLPFVQLLGQRPRD